MKKFSIKDLESISGIKAHTLRIWEKRYNLLEPQRTLTNIRTYNTSDLNYLLNVVLLLDNGYSISQVGAFSADELHVNLSRLDGEKTRREKSLNLLLTHMYEMKIENFEAVLQDAVDEWGIHTVIAEIIVPFLYKSDTTSYRDTSGETHFIVGAIRRKLILGIESLRPQPINKTALLFLPEGEHYDLILLYMTYILKKAGLTTLYLGTNISISNLKRVIASKQPDSLYTYIAGHQRSYLNQILHFALSGTQTRKLNIVMNQERKISDTMTRNLNFVHYRTFHQMEAASM